MYAQDYDEKQPAWQIGGGGTTFYGNRMWWSELYPYVKNPQLFACPTKNATNLWWPGYIANPACYVQMDDTACTGLVYPNLVFDYCVNVYNSGTALADVASPANKVVLADNNANPYFAVPKVGVNWHWYTAFWGLNLTTNPGSNIYVGNHMGDMTAPGFPQGVHTGGCNLGYLDGHVKWQSGSAINGDAAVNWTSG